MTKTITCKSCGLKRPHKALGLCKKCYHREYGAKWYRRQGLHKSMCENRECASFLGVHVAEKVLSKVFKDVEMMSYGNAGYDVICNKDKRIDIKSSCKYIKYNNWSFRIRKNKIADYFLLLAFDNRENLNPLYMWLIPGERINNLSSTTISVSTIHKWDEYSIDIDRVISCCNEMKAADRNV